MRKKINYLDFLAASELPQIPIPVFIKHITAETIGIKHGKNYYILEILEQDGETIQVENLSRTGNFIRTDLGRTTKHQYEIIPSPETSANIIFPPLFNFGPVNKIQSSWINRGLSDGFYHLPLFISHENYKLYLLKSPPKPFLSGDQELIKHYSNSISTGQLGKIYELFKLSLTLPDETEGKNSRSSYFFYNRLSSYFFGKLTTSEKISCVQ